MGQFEIIDRLCAVTTELSDIVRKQAETIEQSDIADEVKAELRVLRDKADTELDLIEHRMRHSL